MFLDRILYLDIAVTKRCATLIAATALVHGMTVVTRNIKDFENTDVEILNPFLS